MKIKSLLFLAFISTIGLYAQTSWTKYAANPVLKRDTNIAILPHDLYAISDCWVLKEGLTYKMWYTGGGFNFPPDTLMRSRICYATSTDGINWNKYASNPVLDVSYGGGWDSLGVETVSIIIDSTAPATQRYKMWYAGQYFNSYRYDIGYAYSSNGINWTKHNKPVLTVGTASKWDNGFIEGPSVVKDGGIYKMWYCGYDATPDGSGTDGKSNIGYATSSDGINWIKYSGNPIIVTGINTWDSINVQDPHVIKENGEYHMWYGGGENDTYYDQQVGYATSPDGINWVKSPLNPVLRRGNSGNWDKILSSFPSVLNDEGIYKMWYTGRNIDPLPSGSSNYYWEIGYATAPISGTNSINTVDNNFIDIFPNPSNGKFTINSSGSISSIEIYNVLGETIYSGLKFSKQISNDIDLYGFPKGIYFVKMYDGKEIYDSKIIIQ